jgi:delta14-sterol reductase
MEPVSWASLGQAALLLGAFVAALFVGSLILPGPICLGAVLADGSRRAYKLNGLALFLLLTAGVAVAAGCGLLSLSILLRLFWPLFLVANGFALALSIALYVLGRQSRERTGHLGRDFFVGSEVNPTWLGVDLKLFAYRPSLMGLALLNAAFAFQQYETHGQLTGRMWLYQAFVFLYVLNYFQFEYGMLYTWDIIAERFGGMLVWGDYVLVPFFYSITGWWVVDQMEPLSPAAGVGLVALYAVGFLLFRGANEQKHRFKANPGAAIWGKPPQAVGGKLLVSGFWGLGRKLNYTGELCIYFAWTATCGPASWVPYVLPAWLTLLLAHRAWRDDRRCRAKYGELWREYCERVRFRMIPFVY